MAPKNVWQPPQRMVDGEPEKTQADKNKALRVAAADAQKLFDAAVYLNSQLKSSLEKNGVPATKENIEAVRSMAQILSKMQQPDYFDKWDDSVTNSIPRDEDPRRARKKGPIFFDPLNAPKGGSVFFDPSDSKKGGPRLVDKMRDSDPGMIILDKGPNTDPGIEIRSKRRDTDQGIEMAPPKAEYAPDNSQAEALFDGKNFGNLKLLVDGVMSGEMPHPGLTEPQVAFLAGLQANLRDIANITAINPPSITLNAADYATLKEIFPELELDLAHMQR